MFSVSRSLSRSVSPLCRSSLSPLSPLASLPTRSFGVRSPQFEVPHTMYVVNESSFDHVEGKGGVTIDMREFTEEFKKGWNRFLTVAGVGTFLYIAVSNFRDYNWAGAKGVHKDDTDDEDEE